MSTAKSKTDSFYWIWANKTWYSTT